MAEFLAAHPGISIEMELSNAPRNLIESRFDLAIRGTLEVGPNLITGRVSEVVEIGRRRNLRVN